MGGGSWYPLRLSTPCAQRLVRSTTLDERTPKSTGLDLSLYQESGAASSSAMKRSTCFRLGACGWLRR